MLDADALGLEMVINPLFPSPSAQGGAVWREIYFRLAALAALEESQLNTDECLHQLRQFTRTKGLANQRGDSQLTLE